MPNGTAELRRHRPPRARIALTFIIVALVLLLVAPFATSRLVWRVRDDVTDVANDARIEIANFQRAFAEELVLGRRPLSDSVRAARRAVTYRMESTAEGRLDSLATRLGADKQMAALHAALDEWRASPEPIERTDEQRVLDASGALYDYFVGASDRGRERVRQLEQIDLYLSAGLAAVALAIMVIVALLDKKVRAFGDMADQRAELLERSVELRATLIQGVVHDVKNPLGAAAGYADLLEEGVPGPLNDEQAEMVRRLKRLMATAQGTVAELVTLARVDSDEYHIERSDTNLVSTVREIVDDHQGRATTKSIRLTFDTPASDLHVNTDALRVRHVVENLLSNALKYTPSGGTVGVDIAAEPSSDHPSQVKVNVRDTGPGIPAEFRDRIFDPFFRVPATERFPGTGLGLAISRRIAGLLGGSLALSEAPGGGSVFSLTLPAA